MKKNLILALAAVTIFSSCAKQDDNYNLATGKASLSVKMDMSKFTRSGDASITTAPDWDRLLLVVTDKNGNFVIEKTITKVDYDALSPAKEIELIEATTNAFLTGGKVKVYMTTIGNEWGPTLSAIGTPNLPVLAADQIDINNWQPSGNIKTDVAGKFVNIPYYGEGTILADGTAHSTHTLLTATVNTAPELGRIQVVNTPIGGTKDIYAVTNIAITGVYINNVGNQDIRTIAGKPESSWITDFYAPGKSLAGMWDMTTNKGYQVFHGNTPHVIVEITYKLTGDNTTHTGYLTIQKFTYEAVSGGDLTVNKGKIYTVDLSGLTIYYDNITDNPYQDITYYDLVAKVTVNPWMSILVTPGI